MNEIIKNMIERRSCRAYKSEMIKDEELDLILKAGEWAASGKGMQVAVMVAIQDPELIKRLSKMNAEILGTDADPFFGAPVVVAVLANKAIRPTYIEDGSLVLGNMMLAASSLGIGSCWVHRAREECESEEGKKLKKEWGLSDDYVGIGHVVLGYPSAPLPKPQPRKEGRIIKIR